MRVIEATDISCKMVKVRQESKCPRQKGVSVSRTSRITFLITVTFEKLHLQL